MRRELYIGKALHFLQYILKEFRATKPQKYCRSSIWDCLYLLSFSMVVMIPVVLYLVYYTSITKSKAGIRLGMKNIVVRWFIPVIAIPSLWPIHSIVDNQFDLWLSDVWLQSTRATECLIATIQSFIM